MWKIRNTWIILNKSRQRSTCCDLLSHKHTTQSNEYKFICFRRKVSFSIFFFKENSNKFEHVYLVSWMIQVIVFNTFFYFFLACRYNESIRNSEHSKNENRFISTQTRNKVAASTMGIKDLDALAKTIKRKKCQSVFYCLFVCFCHFFFTFLRKSFHFHRTRKINK